MPFVSAIAAWRFASMTGKTGALPTPTSEISAKKEANW